MSHTGYTFGSGWVRIAQQWRGVFLRGSVVITEGPRAGPVLSVRDLRAEETSGPVLCRRPEDRHGLCRPAARVDHHDRRPVRDRRFRPDRDRPPQPHRDDQGRHPVGACSTSAWPRCSRACCSSSPRVPPARSSWPATSRSTASASTTSSSSSSSWRDSPSRRWRRTRCSTSASSSRCCCGRSSSWPVRPRSPPPAGCSTSSVRSSSTPRSGWPSRARTTRPTSRRTS